MPAGIEQAVVNRLDDQAPEVREAAIMAAVGLRLHSTVPRLIAIARNQSAPDRSSAIAALCRLPDPAAFPIYMGALENRDPSMRRAGERALVAIRDKVAGELATSARNESISEPAALALERIRARFEPILRWRVIGPFPRTTPPIFLGERSIDFQRGATGAMGREVTWAIRAGERSNGAVVLDDLKQPIGVDGGFAYAQSGSLDLGAFAYAEVNADHAGPALLLFGSSGSLFVTVNEKLVYQHTEPAGRAYEPDSDRSRVELDRGRNRIVVLSRQGIGNWCFSMQIAKLKPEARVAKSVPNRAAELRRYAMESSGDPRMGEVIFFDAKGAGCVKCHAVGSRGTSTIGPNLAGVARTYDRAELIRSVLEPSSRIAPAYQTVVMATRDGKVMNGVIRAESDQEVVLGDSEARTTHVAKPEIIERRSSNVSVMPARAAETLSPREFADLIGYLASLTDVPRTARVPAEPSSPRTESTKGGGR